MKALSIRFFLKKITTPFFFTQKRPRGTSAETLRAGKKNEISRAKNNKTVEVEDSDLGGVQGDM